MALGMLPVALLRLKLWCIFLGLACMEACTLLHQHEYGGMWEFGVRVWCVSGLSLRACVVVESGCWGRVEANDGLPVAYCVAQAAHCQQLVLA